MRWLHLLCRTLIVISWYTLAMQEQELKYVIEKAQKIHAREPNKAAQLTALTIFNIGKYTSELQKLQATKQKELQQLMSNSSVKIEPPSWSDFLINNGGILLCVSGATLAKDLKMFSLSCCSYLSGCALLGYGCAINNKNQKIRNKQNKIIDLQEQIDIINRCLHSKSQVML